MMSSKPPPQLDAVLADGIFRLENWIPYQCSFVANRVSATLARRYRDEFGISQLGWRVIAVLATHPPMSAKELSELTGMDQVSVTRAVNQLVKQRLVLRKTDTVDRRRVVLRLSAKGSSIFAAVLPLARTTEETLIKYFSAAELAALRKAMNKLVDAAARAITEASAAK